MISMHKSGDIIYKAQDKPKSIFIIHSGSIEILTKSGVPLATLNEGEIFGEISEILAENRSVTARAKTSPRQHLLHTLSCKRADQVVIHIMKEVDEATQRSHVRLDGLNGVPQLRC